MDSAVMIKITYITGTAKARHNDKQLRLEKVKRG